MKTLLVLVGPPGSGKTTYQRRHPEWAVVSKDDIRQLVFRAGYTSEHEDAVENMFATALVEAVETDIETVCVDGEHLTRDERRRLIEVAVLSGRRPIAHVLLPPDARTDSTRAQRESSISGYPPATEDEGFARVELIEASAQPAEPPMPEAKRTKKRAPRRDPLPLFVS